MKNKYLTSELKISYLQDFNTSVLNSEKLFWRLDDNLRDILIAINKNEHIQTLYSKRHQLNNFVGEPNSYLKICYISEIELKLFREIVPAFVKDYNIIDKESLFNYTFSYPEIDPIESENHIGLRCADDNNYFNINVISFDLVCHDIDIHDLFWNDLKIILEKI